jgi:hypothetical protein
MPRGEFTIIELLQDERIDALSATKEHKKFRWGLGTAISVEWRKVNGTEPPRKMQQKTNQSTKCQAPHMKCTYPASFRRHALKVLARFKTTRSAQGDLFDA